MNTKLLLVCLIGILGQVSLPASAQMHAPINVQANCSFDRAVGQCVVFNSWSTPIYCQLRVRGRVASGAWFNGYENVMIPPGQNAYAYVYANNPQYDPLVTAQGSANCRF